MAMSKFRITPSLGPDLLQVVRTGEVWYNSPPEATPQLGSTCQGNDGRSYIWLEASGAITVGSGDTETQLAAPTTTNFVVGSGTGGFYLVVTANNFGGANLAAGDRFWAAKGTAPLA